MFIVMFFLLGACFGFAARLPWGLLAFLFPIGLVLTASDRDPGAILLGFAVTAIGLLVGLVLGTRADERTA
jgi:hypothetical protein